MSGKTTTVRFLLASALSLLGNSVAGIALPLILLATTGDPLAAGTLALACAVPQVLAGVLGGPYSTGSTDAMFPSPPTSSRRSALPHSPSST